jgi:hypothetical protein
MKTKIFLLSCLFLAIGLMNASGQKGTPYHAYPERVFDNYGCTWVTCDGVNVDFLEYEWDGTDILKVREAGTSLKEICHWKFTSAITGEEFKVVELVNMDLTLDSEGYPLQAEGICRANLRGDAGSHYKTTIFLSVTFPNTIYLEFLDFKCF